MSRGKLHALVSLALDDVKRVSLPPIGQPFIDADGVPYYTRDDFLDDLASEIRERIYEYAGAREGGQYYLLGKPSLERAQGGL